MVSWIQLQTRNAMLTCVLWYLCPANLRPVYWYTCTDWYKLKMAEKSYFRRIDGDFCVPVKAFLVGCPTHTFRELSLEEHISFEDE